MSNRIASTKEEVGACKNSGNSPDNAIDGCSAVIQKYGRLAWALNNRCYAYYRRADYDHALADCGEAIRLDPKLAAAYNGRGNAYKAKGDYDRAITDYSEAIQLDPKMALAYGDRGNAYEAEGKYDRAITDYGGAIQLDPKLADAYNARGNAYKAKGDYDRAIADYDQALVLDPKNAWAYFYHGVASLYVGSLADALTNFDRSSEIDPKNPYTAIWLEIVNKRSNLPSRLAQAIMQIDMAKWPAPIIRLYLGELTPAAVLAADDDPDANTKKGQVCEANFYGGELALQHGVKEEAARLFRLATTNCPKTFLEWSAAGAELKALGESR